MAEKVYELAESSVCEAMSDPEFQHLRPDAEEQIARHVAREAPAA